MSQPDFIKTLPRLDLVLTTSKDRDDKHVTYINASDSVDLILSSLNSITDLIRNLMVNNPVGRRILLEKNPDIMTSMNRLLVTLANIYKQEVENPTERIDPPLETLKDEDEEYACVNDVFIKVGFKPYMESVYVSIEKLILAMVLIEQDTKNVEIVSEGDKGLQARISTFEEFIKLIEKFTDQRKSGEGKGKV
jgi:hypothetical protein